MPRAEVFMRFWIFWPLLLLAIVGLAWVFDYDPDYTILIIVILSIVYVFLVYYGTIGPALGRVRYSIRHNQLRYEEVSSIIKMELDDMGIPYDGQSTNDLYKSKSPDRLVFTMKWAGIYGYIFELRPPMLQGTRLIILVDMVETEGYEFTRIFLTPYDDGTRDFLEDKTKILFYNQHRRSRVYW